MPYFGMSVPVIPYFGMSVPGIKFDIVKTLLYK